MVVQHIHARCHAFAARGGFARTASHGGPRKHGTHERRSYAARFRGKSRHAGRGSRRGTRPLRAIISTNAGTRNGRTTKVSSSTPKASAKPICTSVLRLASINVANV